MSNLAVQNNSYTEQKSFSEKASPVPPQDGKVAKKAQGAFRTISEVADELDVPQHVLRFWETKFSQVKPLKRGGGRRYYRPEDVALLKHIHYQLYTEGYTIKGVQKLLKGQGKNQIAAQVAADEQASFSAQVKQTVSSEQSVQSAAQAQPQAQQAIAQVEGKVSFDKPAKIYNLSDRQRGALEDMLGELKALRALLPEEAA